jgi:hypothetical protein
MAKLGSICGPAQIHAYAFQFPSLFLLNFKHLHLSAVVRALTQFKKNIKSVAYIYNTLESGDGSFVRPRSYYRTVNL